MTIKELHRSVVARIKEIAGISVSDNDLSEPIRRPCIKISSMLDEIEFINKDLLREKVAIDVYYFAPNKDKYRKANAEMSELLCRGLLEKPIETAENEPICVENIDISEQDTVLVCSFYINAYLTRDESEDATEKMNELNIKLK